MCSNSLESSRSKAYSQDLRWRMIHKRCSLGLTYSQISDDLNVDLSTVWRTVKLFEETGTVESIQGFHQNTTKKLSTQDEIMIIEAVLEKPSVYLHELKSILLKTTGTISVQLLSTIF